jgi:hypothetical protein
MGTSTEPIAALHEFVERRFYPRVAPCDPIYIGRDHENQGVLLNVSENGLLVSTQVPLKVNFVSRISVPVNGLANAITGYARVIWTSETTNCAGIQLLELSEQGRKQLRDWIAAEFSRSSRQDEEKSLGAAATLIAPRERLAAEPQQTTSAITPVAAAERGALVVRKRPASLVEVAAWGFLIGSLSVAAVMFGRDLVPRGGAAAGLAAAGRSSSGAAKQNEPNPSPVQQPPQTWHSPASAVSDSRSSADLESSRPTAAENVPPAQTPNREPVETAGGVPRKATSAPATSVPVSSASAAPNHPRRNTAQTENGATQPDTPAQQNTKLPPSVTSMNPAGNLTALKSSAVSVEGAYSRSTPAVAERSNDAPERVPVPAKIISTDINPAARPNVVSDDSRANPVSGTPYGSRSALGTIVQLNPSPQRTLLEVRSLAGSRAAMLPLPGSRVFESPAATMHVERSLRLPATRKWWPFDRKRTVAVGELVSRVDPQSPYVPLGPGVSVRVEATVGEDGRVERLRLIRGPAAVVPDVMRAIREWRYQPTLVDGKPVETDCIIEVQFHSTLRAAR